MLKTVAIGWFIVAGLSILISLSGSIYMSGLGSIENVMMVIPNMLWGAIGAAGTGAVYLFAARVLPQPGAVGVLGVLHLILAGLSTLLSAGNQALIMSQDVSAEQIGLMFSVSGGLGMIGGVLFFIAFMIAASDVAPQRHTYS